MEPSRKIEKKKIPLLNIAKKLIILGFLKELKSY